MVRESDLDLGVQLLPGMPGQTAAAFGEDVRRTAALRPRMARLYPCLVLKGAPLAGAWRRGEYSPWELGRTVQELACAARVFWDAGVVLGRLGVAQESGLEQQIIAGPWHPALGCRIRGEALFMLVEQQVRKMKRKPAGLLAPRRYQGEFWGHKGELAPLYENLGLARSTVRFVQKGYFVLS